MYFNISREYLIYIMCIIGCIRTISGMLWILYDIIHTLQVYYVYFNISSEHLRYILFIIGCLRYISGM